METTSDRRSSTWLGPEVMVCTYIVCALLIPANYTLVGALGDVGRPSVVIGLGMLVLWGLGFLVPGLTRSSFTPVRTFILILVLAWNTSVAFAYLRGLSVVETSGVERYYLRTLALCGVGLYVSECLVSRESIERVLRMLVGVGAIVGAIGAAQFYLDIDLVRIIQLPLPLNHELDPGLATRGSADLSRATSTLQHSIELSVVSAMILPIAVHRALRDTKPGNRIWPWLLVGLCGIGIPLSISRSGVVAAIAVMVVMVRPWRKELRRHALVVAILIVGALRVTTPGLVGTLVSFFRNAESDDSVTGRTEDYDNISTLFSEHPWFGMGGGTFRPEEYFVVDNYFLVMLVSAGVVGVLALAVLFLGPYSLSVRTGRSALDASDRNLAFALAGSLMAAFATSFTFDSLAFSGFAATLFVIIGVVGATWRLPRSADHDGWVDMGHLVKERAALVPLTRRLERSYREAR